MPQDSQYQSLVTAFYQAIINPAEEALLKDAMELAAGFEEEVVQEAMR